MKLSYILLITLAIGFYTSFGSEQAHAQTSLDCPTGYTDRRVSPGEVSCSVREIVPSLAEAEDLVQDLTNACEATVGGTLSFSSSDPEFVSTGGATGNFTAFASCTIAVDTSDVQFCPERFFALMRSETDLNCSGSAFGATAQEAQDQIDSLGSACMAVENSVTNASDVEMFFVSGSSGYTASISCDISLVVTPEFGPFENPTIVRACDASCTLDEEESRVCINGNIGDIGCDGPTTRIVSSSCNTGREGLCPITTNSATGPINLLLLDD